MFGYVRVDAPDLRVRENEYYKALYCGLCRAQGKATGQCSRLSLSYDFVCMAALRLVLAGAHPTLERRRCPAHPFRRRPSVGADPQLAVCADAAAILAGLKCLDDIADEKGFRRLRARVRYRVVRRGFRRAEKRHPETVAQAKDLLGQLSELERERVPSADRPAHLCGDLTGLMFALDLTGNERTIAHAFGVHVGRWIYLVDAVDDWREDLDAGRYNPLICLYPEAGAGDPHVIDDLRVALKCELADAAGVLDLIDFDGYDELRAILWNMVYRGMPGEAERVFARATDTDKAPKTKDDQNEKGGQ